MIKKALAAVILSLIPSMVFAADVVAKARTWGWTIASISAIFVIFIIIGRINPPQIQILDHKPMNVSDPEISKSIIGVWQDTNYMADGPMPFSFFQRANLSLTIRKWTVQKEK